MTISPDANIFIYALNAHPEFGPESLVLLKLIEGGALTGISTELTILEVLSDKTLSPQDVKKSQRLLDLSGTVFVPIDRTVLLKAAELRRKHGLKAADAVHIATAILNGVDYFVTNDLYLTKKAIGGLKIIKLADAKTTFVHESL